MNTPTAATRAPSLKTLQGQVVPLQALDIQGRLEGALAHIGLTQTFRNLEEINVEAVYTFPLPVQAVLLELKVTIADRTLRGRVTSRQRAEVQYEEALADGHTAVMLEQVEPGLYTLNLGNLRAGERAQIHLRYALPMRWEGNELRLSLPTTLAPRYGDAVRAGVQPHQLPQSDTRVEYPYTLSLTIGGALSLAMLSSPTHAIATERDGATLVVRIADAHAFADRDFVLKLEAAGAAQSSFALAADGEGQAAHAAFRIPERKADQPICLRVLVDCSGSMAGDSMAIAKALAMRSLDRLGAKDRFSLTAFGSGHRHHANGKVCDAGSGAALVQGRSFVGGLDADLGGTEMLSALQSVFESKQGRRDGEAADVLLITDGETWDRDAIVAAARASGHRIFVIGVGSSPSEILARGIAEATGGFASFVAPREDVAAVIERHLARMRLPRVVEAKLKLPGQRLWQCPANLEAATFAGDTLHVFAGLAGAKISGDAHLDLRYADGSIITVSAAREPGSDANTDEALPRIGAAQRLWWAGAGLVDSSEQELTDVALRYQLMSAFTNYILVHERGEDAATYLPALRAVPGMLAAGWGGAGSVMPCEVQACMPAPSPVRSAPATLRDSAKRKAVRMRDASPQAPAGASPKMFGAEEDAAFERACDQADSPRELIERLNPSFGLLHPERHVVRRFVALESAGLPQSVLEGLRAIQREGWDEPSVVLALWKVLLGLPLAQCFGRMHRRGILAALKAAHPDDVLIMKVQNLLQGTDADRWRWNAVPAELVAPV